MKPACYSFTEASLELAKSNSIAYDRIVEILHHYSSSSGRLDLSDVKEGDILILVNRDVQSAQRDELLDSLHQSSYHHFSQVFLQNGILKAEKFSEGKNCYPVSMYNKSLVFKLLPEHYDILFYTDYHASLGFITIPSVPL